MNEERDRFVNNTFGPLLSFVQRHVRQRQTAEDILQDGYAYVFARPGFDVSRPAATGYLWRKVNWLILDHYRDRDSRFGSLSLEWMDEREPSPEQKAETAEVCAIVRQAVSRLEERHQAVLVRLLDGKSPEKMAQELKLPLQRVYRLLHDGRAALRRELDEDGRALAALSR